VLIAICAAGVSMRLYFVARHKAHERNGRTSLLPAALGLLTLAGVAFALMPQPRGGGAQGGDARALHRASHASRPSLPNDASAATQPPPPNQDSVPSQRPAARYTRAHPGAHRADAQQIATRAMPWATLPASPKRNEPKC